MIKKITKCRFMPLFLFVVFIVFVLISLFAGFKSIGIDNYLISNVKADVYSDGSYCILLGAVLNSILSSLVKVLPNTDCFVLLQIVNTLIGQIWLGWLFYKADKSCPKLAISYLVMLSIYFIMSLNCCNFTITAAFFTVVGFVSLYYYVFGYVNSFGLILGLFFLFFGYQWRFKSFILVIPFAALFGVYCLLIAKKNISINRNRLIKSVSLSLTIVAFSVCAQMINDSSAINIDNSNYNSCRVALVDYPNVEYSLVERELSEHGISENDYYAVTNMILFDRDIETADYFKEIVDAGIKPKHDVVTTFLSALYALFNLSYVNYCALILLIIIYVKTSISNPEFSIELGFSLFGLALLVLMLAFMQRTPDRVLSALLLIGFVPILLYYPKICFKNDAISFLIVLGFCLASIANFYHINHLEFSNPYNVLFAKTNNKYEEMSQFYDNTNTFIWDVHLFDEVLLSNDEYKLLSQDLLDNNIVDGEWTFGQKYYNDYFERIGMDNPMESLLYEDNWFYVGAEYKCQIIEKWLQEHYDEKAIAYQVDTFHDMGIWSFDITQ